MKKATKLLKYQVHPLIFLISFVSIMVLVTTIGGILHYSHELDSKVFPGSGSLISSKAENGSYKSTLNSAQHGVLSTSSQNDNNQNSNPQTASNNSSQTLDYGVGTKKAATSSQATQAVVKVSLSINGIYKGPVSLSASSNQCNVLSQAYSQGIISSLDMRYNSQYKTYGVYAIDGIGDSSSVWWTYKVNGSSPPYGCSHMAVHNGDSINWQYVKG